MLAHIFVLLKKPNISTSHTDNVFLVSKAWFFRNTPRFRQVLILELWYNVGPKSLHSLKIPRFWQAKVGHGFFWHQETRFVWYNPRFWQVLKLGFGYDVDPISLYSLKAPSFDKPHRQCVFGVKNLVVKKYPKISTGVNPGILIQCRPNIFALFKKPKILTSKIWPLVFGVKNMVLWRQILTRQDSDTC